MELIGKQHIYRYHKLNLRCNSSLTGGSTVQSVTVLYKYIQSIFRHAAASSFDSSLHPAWPWCHVETGTVVLVYRTLRNHSANTFPDINSVQLRYVNYFVHPFQLERGTVSRCSKISSFPPVATVFPWEMSGRHSLFFIWRGWHELVGTVRAKLKLFLVLKFYLNQAESENYKMCGRPTINTRAVRIVNIGVTDEHDCYLYAGSLVGAFSPLLFFSLVLFLLSLK